MEAEYRISLDRRYDHDVEQIDNLHDELERSHIASAIASELKSDNRARVIGIYGWWGSGKSYLLSQTIKLLFDDNLDTQSRRPRADGNQ